MRKLENRIIVWPSYFDTHNAKKHGRRVPRRICVELPRVEELVQVSDDLRPEIVQEARYPKAWWMKSGYLIVDKQVSKKATLNRIGQKLADLRRFSLNKAKK